MEWQPIETAPKDGEAVILFFPDTYWLTGENMAVGFWGGIGDADEGWFHGEADSQGMAAFGSHPTHWMPLPNPPSKT